MPNNNSSNHETNITKSVMAVNEIVLGSAASTSMAAMYVAMAHATGVAAQNTVANQQHSNILGTAALAAGTGNMLWSGLNNDLLNLPTAERLKNWEQMRAIATGAEPEQANQTSAEDTEQPGAPSARPEGVPQS